jgi:hypothetical protein
MKQIALLCMLSIAPKALGQLPTAFGVWDQYDYRSKVRTIAKNYIHNFRVECEQKMWDFNRKQYRIDRFDSHVTSSFHDEGRWVQVVYTGLTNGKFYSFGQYIDTDSKYQFSGNGKGTPFKLDSFSTEWKDPIRYYDRFNTFVATSQIYKPTSQESITRWDDNATFDGRNAIKVETRNSQFKTLRTIYLDRATYQLLHTWEVSEIAPDDKSVPLKIIVNVEYFKKNGIRTPAKYEMYRLLPDGKRENMIERIFTVYEPHVATEDDLSIEKHFGIKPIPHEARPSGVGTRKSYFYLTLTFLTLAVLIGAIVYFRWKRKRAARTNLLKP